MSTTKIPLKFGTLFHYQNMKYDGIRNQLNNPYQINMLNLCLFKKIVSKFLGIYVIQMKCQKHQPKNTDVNKRCLFSIKYSKKDTHVEYRRIPTRSPCNSLCKQCMLWKVIVLVYLSGKYGFILEYVHISERFPWTYRKIQQIKFPL